MHALIMAGGMGSRLDQGEKPLISVSGKPMIAYIINAFSAAGIVPVVAASPKTPMTMNWCRAQGIAVCKADGRGYVEDMISAVQTLDDPHPLFVCVSDVPCITQGIIHQIADSYFASGKDACSVWVPAALVHACRGGMPYREQVCGVEACPAGINILRGDLIEQPQEEQQVLLNEPGLALNVNTPADLARAENFLQQRSLKKSLS
jgi:adenosylcobinamide-phosphate guanylyltransferase